MNTRYKLSRSLPATLDSYHRHTNHISLGHTVFSFESAEIAQSLLDVARQPTRLVERRAFESNIVRDDWLDATA